MSRLATWGTIPLIVMFCGCGSSQPTTADSGKEQTSAEANGAQPAGRVAAASTEPGPQATVHEFLTALFAADRATAEKLLTAAAREDAAEHGLQVAPDGSDTATFKIGQVEYVTEAKDGAHVASTVTDINENQEPETEEVVWILHREEAGWRVAGMATKIFDDAPPLFWNFEDQEDIQRKKELLAQEFARRAGQTEGSARQAQQPDTTTRTQ